MQFMNLTHPLGNCYFYWHLSRKLRRYFYWLATPTTSTACSLKLNVRENMTVTFEYLASFGYTFMAPIVGEIEVVNGKQVFITRSARGKSWILQWEYSDTNARRIEARPRSRWTWRSQCYIDENHWRIQMSEGTESIIGFEYVIVMPYASAA